MKSIFARSRRICIRTEHSVTRHPHLKEGIAKEVICSRIINPQIRHIATRGGRTAFPNNRSTNGHNYICPRTYIVTPGIPDEPIAPCRHRQSICMRLITLQPDTPHRKRPTGRLVPSTHGQRYIRCRINIAYCAVDIHQPVPRIALTERDILHDNYRSELRSY